MLAKSKPGRSETYLEYIRRDKEGIRSGNVSVLADVLECALEVK